MFVFALVGATAFLRFTICVRCGRYNLLVSCTICASLSLSLAVSLSLSLSLSSLPLRMRKDKDSWTSSHSARLF